MQDLSRAVKVANCTARLLKNPSGATNSASGRSRSNAARAASISPIVLALKIWICSPRVGAACCTSRIVDLAVEATAGLTSTAMRTALGARSCSSRSRSASHLLVKKVDAGRVAARPGEAGDETKLDRVCGRRRRRSGSSLLQLWPRAQRECCPAWRSRLPVGGPDQPPAPAGDRSGLPASGTRPLTFWPSTAPVSSRPLRNATA